MTEITSAQEEGYKRMAADEEHEAEALEWSEGLIGDVAELLERVRHSDLCNQPVKAVGRMI